MRLIGLILVALLLAVLATFAYERRSLYVPEFVAAVSGGPMVHDQRFNDPDADPLSARGTRAEILPSTTEAWVGLSGLNAFSHVEFPLPQDVGINGGEMVLNLTSELEEGAVARMRFNVNGTKRGEIVLESGILEHQVLLPLRAEDLLSDRAILTMSTEGVNPHVVCRANWDGGVVIRLRPNSTLRLALDAPLTAAQDRLMAAGIPARVVWPAEASASHKAALLRLAVARGGVDFIASAPEGADILLTEQDASAVADSLSPPAIMSMEWPVAVNQLNASTAIRDLQRTTIWRIPYDRRLLPGQGMPTALSLGLRVGAMGRDNWLLTVSQDGQLIHSEALVGENLDILRDVPLNKLQGDPMLTGSPFSGTIEVALRRLATLGARERRDGDDYCRELIPAVGELTQASVLRGADDPNYFGGLFAGLKRPAQLQTTTELSAQQAMLGIATLQSLFPKGTVQLTGAEVGEPAARIAVLPEDGLAERVHSLMSEMPEAGHWLYWLTTDAMGGQIPHVLRPDAKNLQDIGGGNHVAVLISMP